ncbi:iron-containing alcohol dehydrogenase [Diplocloster modestus]|uniref:Iron-containing alcohol dehydrogenase n=1 Tax=Diplocloster modestus TaxID=2850322 RepID=A0ABS6KEA9_9FIRM|nr:iron-containing alcohol dehydrogenase [Diplocloster modestus]MBU9728831.1 iron-containing alcohol dehydrogenase [Diplocloster modestus]
MQFQYFIPTRILFGKGELSNLHKQQLPGKKALIVTSAGNSVKKYGYLSRLEEQLEQAGISHVLFDKILPNPIKEHVMEGAALARENGCDFVIGLGGGSSIDSAKAVAVMAANDGDYWDYISGGSGKGKELLVKPLPIVAITTTAGTGTEADPFAVVTNGQEKIGFGCDGTFPVLAVVDPELMMSIPPHLTAYQGFDALFHSTEGYISKAANEVSDLFALRAIELIGQSLAKAVENGSDPDARADVALANTLAGMVESTSGCISEHSMEHAMSAYHHQLPHGAGLIMISREYYTFMAESKSCDGRLVTMAKALGFKDAKEPMDFVKALTDLQKACGVDQLKMSGYGITLEELPQMAANAKETMGGLFAGDPTFVSVEAAAEIYRRSYR